MASVIHRGNNHWELRISFGYRNEKQIRLTKRIRASPLRAAKKELERFCHEVAEQPHNRADSRMRFGDVVAVWEERHDSRLSLLTRELPWRVREWKQQGCCQATSAVCIQVEWEECQNG